MIGKKKRLIGRILIAAFCVVCALSPVYVNAQEPAVQEAPQYYEEQKIAPTEVKWKSLGEVSYVSHGSTDVIYALSLERDGKREQLISLPHMAEGQEYTLDVISFIIDPGVYVARCYAINSWSDRNPVYSEEVPTILYERAGKQLQTVTNLHWEKPGSILWMAYDKVDNAGKYYVRVYENGKMFSQIITATSKTVLSQTLTKGAVYQFSVRAMAADPKEYFRSEESFSPVLIIEDEAEEGYANMYRLYNPNSGEHFYTADAGERDNLVFVGWNYEGIAWKAPETSATPVFRLYNPNAGDHHYTPSEQERDDLVRAGWQYEGIGWYSDDAKGMPLHRLYNPNAVSGSHHYTTSEEEKNNLVNVGWRYEGIGWYGAK